MTTWRTTRRREVQSVLSTQQCSTYCHLLHTFYRYLARLDTQCMELWHWWFRITPSAPIWGGLGPSPHHGGAPLLAAADSIDSHLSWKTGRTRAWQQTIVNIVNTNNTECSAANAGIIVSKFSGAAVRKCNRGRNFSPCYFCFIKSFEEMRVMP